MIRIAMKIILLIDEWIPLNARHSRGKEFYLADTLEHSCFWYIDTFDFSTRNIFHCHGKIMSSLEMRMNTRVFYFFCPDMEVCVSCNQHDSWWKRRHISISFGHTGLLKYEEGICYWRVFHLACHIIHNTGQPLKSRLPSHRRKSVQFS